MKCDTPVTLPGGLTAGCTLDAPHPGLEHEYVKEDSEFSGRVVLCPVCSTNVGDTSERTFECTTCDTQFSFGEPDPTEQPAPDETENTEETDFSGAILMCPICQATIDAEKWGPQTVTCAADNTQFTVNLREDAVMEHSMY